MNPLRIRIRIALWTLLLLLVSPHGSSTLLVAFLPVENVLGDAVVAGGAGSLGGFLRGGLASLLGPLSPPGSPSTVTLRAVNVSWTARPGVTTAADSGVSGHRVNLTDAVNLPWDGPPLPPSDPPSPSCAAARWLLGLGSRLSTTAVLVADFGADNATASLALAALQAATEADVASAFANASAAVSDCCGCSSPASGGAPGLNASALRSALANAVLYEPVGPPEDAPPLELAPSLPEPTAPPPPPPAPDSHPAASPELVTAATALVCVLAALVVAGLGARLVLQRRQRQMRIQGVLASAGALVAERNASLVRGRREQSITRLRSASGSPSKGVGGGPAARGEEGGARDGKGGGGGGGGGGGAALLVLSPIGGGRG
jgi:hypothetical protein